MIDNLNALNTVSYGYDSLGRLWHAKAGYQHAPLWTETYLFDTYGNRTSVAVTGQAPGRVPMPSDGLPALSYDSATNRVTSPGFGYDAMGNQTRAQRPDGSWLRYKYDAAGRLAVVTDDSGHLIEGLLYGSNRRPLLEIGAGQIPIQTTLFWDGDHLISEYAAAASNQLRWFKDVVYLGGSVLATFLFDQSGKVVYYHHPDRLGTRLVSNNKDATVVNQETLPFGNLVPGQSPNNPINPMFITFDRSSATGLDYALNRHYDPNERFIEVDPLGMAALDPSTPHTLNLYEREFPF
jgi:YD repeat-containing protein